jgi:hypothetical protein
LQRRLVKERIFLHILSERVSQHTVNIRVADQRHFNANPDPNQYFHFDAEPDLTFYFHADPNTDPGPHQRDANLLLQPLVYRTFWALLWASTHPLRA